MLDSLQGHLAITTSGSLGRLVHSLCLERPPGRPDSTVLVLGGVIRVAGRSRPTRIGHGYCVCKCRLMRKQKKEINELKKTK